MARVAILVDVVPDEIQARAGKLGWEIISAGENEYTVGVPGQRNLKIHTSLTSVETALLRRERALKDQKERANAEKHEQLKLEAKKTVRQNHALKTATGDYLVAAPLDLDWVRQRHPTPAVRMCIITPEDAKAILDANPDNYRDTRETHVTSLGNVMRVREWHLTHQAIAFDTNGKQIDGRHRMKACSNSGVTIMAMVFVGMDPDTIRYIDEGRARTAYDLLKHTGYGANRSLPPTVRLILGYNSEYPHATLRNRVPNADINAFVEKNPTVADAARRGVGLKGTRRGDDNGTINNVALGAAVYLLGEVAKTDSDHEAIDRFLFGLATGCQDRGIPGGGNHGRMLLATTDPRHRVRVWLKRVDGGHNLGRARVPALTQLALIMTAWNHMVEGDRPRRLDFDPEAPNYPFPKRVTPALVEAVQ